MRSKMVGLLAALICTLAFSPSIYALPYALDDGSAEVVLGTAQNRDLLWLNSFNAQPGSELITTLSAQWGSVPWGSGANLPVSLLLYDDPNNDGSPLDAVLLTSVLTTATEYATGNFVDVAITPTAVSGGFFVAALLENTPDGRTFMAPFDTNSPQGKSWVAFSADLDITDLSAAFTILDGVGSDGNFMLRADATHTEAAPVPEASTIFLLGSGLLGLGWYGRKRKKA